jgi:hypothetical protein
MPGFNARKIGRLIVRAQSDKGQNPEPLAHNRHLVEQFGQARIHAPD